jgi:hypothetical protein
LVTGIIRIFIAYTWSSVALFQFGVFIQFRSPGSSRDYEH